MKSNRPRFKPASIAKTRWAAYATAGAASAFTCANSAEAAIHYSGRIDDPFRGRGDHQRTLTLDQPGDSFVLERSNYDGYFIDRFWIYGIQSAAFRGRCCLSCYPYGPYVSKLTLGQKVSNGDFYAQTQRFAAATLARADFQCLNRWTRYGGGFIGFRFNNGAGVQYGWVRILIAGVPGNAFRLFDYAYADPGEPIRTGQISSDEQPPDQGSLGWLALGAVGLLAWRKSRSRKL